MTIIEALDDPRLLGAAFPHGMTWGAWRAFLAAVFGLPMTEDEACIFRRHTGRDAASCEPAREVWCIAGRRAGKSRIAAVLAVFIAAFRHYHSVLAPGEKATVAVIAADRQQARVVFRYICGLLDGVPMLRALVERRTQSAVELRGNVVIEVHTCSYRTTRGYSFAAVIADECAFWRDETSASPDVEVLNALRPGLATIPGAVLVAISSPYSQRGALWNAYRQHYGRDGDPVLVWKADTRSMNPTVPGHVIAEALAADEPAARAEWLAEFRSDLEAFVSREVIEAATVPGRTGLPPMKGIRYVGFTDPSGGSADAFALAVAHGEVRGDSRIVVLDYLSERRPPFSPEAVAAEFAQVLKSYGVTRVQADHYAGAWVAEAFANHGVTCEQSAEPKSVIYANALPLLNSARVELLDHPRLHAQLISLERRTARGGRDTIDHAPGRYDDLANAVAGALVSAGSPPVIPFLRRSELITAIVRPGRRHPFSREESTLRDNLTVLAEAFDLGAEAPRAVHVALGPNQAAAGFALGYVPGLRPVTRPKLLLAGSEHGGAQDLGRSDGDLPALAPVFVIEAVLRILAVPNDEVRMDDVVDLVVQLRDEIGVPIRWVTATRFGSLSALQALRMRGMLTGEVSVDTDPRPYEELKSALYDGRIETYAYVHFSQQLARLEVDERTGGVRAPVTLFDLQSEGVGGAKEVADAVAGLVHLLARRGDSWQLRPRPDPPRSNPRRLSFVP